MVAPVIIAAAAAIARTVTSMSGGSLQRAQARGRNARALAEADAANLVREGKNEERAGAGSLSRWMQGENNRRRLQAAGDIFNSATMTFNRVQDAAIRGSVEDQIGAAEAAGAYAAHVALSGAAGSSVDIVDTTARLKNERAFQMRAAAQAGAKYDALQRISGILPQATAGLDLTTFADGIDYSRTVANIQPVQGNWLLDGLQGFGGIAQNLNQATGASTTTAPGGGIRFDTPAPSSYQLGSYDYSFGGFGQQSAPAVGGSGQGLSFGGGGQGLQASTSNFWSSSGSSFRL